MTRSFAFVTASFVATIIAFAQDESPKTDTGESFEIEPPLLIPNRSDEPSLALAASARPDQDVDLVHLEKDLERARKNAAGVERFCKIGALSKLEAEQRALRVVRLESDLANARLERAKAEVSGQEARVASGEIANDELEAAKAAVTELTELAQVAAAKRARAELDAAEANVHRQEKLLALGSARKSDVARAEQKLAELKAQTN